MNKKYLRIGILTLSLVFIFIGYYKGEASMVFMKAIRICLECIGIG